MIAPIIVGLLVFAFLMGVNIVCMKDNKSDVAGSYVTRMMNTTKGKK